MALRRGDGGRVDDRSTHQQVDRHSSDLFAADATIVVLDDGRKKKLMLGPRGVIRLSRDEDVTTGLGITEGIEDGLAVLLSGWSPVWAATCAPVIKSFPVLPGIEALTIFADCDVVGMEAAESCADRWRAKQCDVAIKGMTI
jgi:hypothetical protein